MVKFTHAISKNTQRALGHSQGTRGQLKGHLSTQMTLQGHLKGTPRGLGYLRHLRYSGTRRGLGDSGTWALGHWELGHSVTRALGHLGTWALGHSRHFI